MDKKFLLIISIFFSLFLCGNLFAQQNYDSEFNIGLDLYNASQYEDALNIFSKISSASAFNSKTTIALIFKAKTEIKLEKYNDAETSLLMFLELYPNSKYSDEARLALAKVYLKVEEYQKSFSSLVELISRSDSPFYRNYSKSTGEKIALKYLNASDIEDLLNVNSGERIIPFLLLIDGKLLIAERNFDSAEESLLKILTDYPDSFERSEAGELYRNAGETNGSGSNKEEELIGILLPLDYSGITDDALKTANEILDGIKFAVSNFNKGREKKIGLVIRNTEMNNDKITEIKEEFKKIPSLRMIIGPIYSMEVKDALEIFNDLDIPIISPTATENDLTLLNDHFFQANPSFSVRGKIMAQYIYYVENKRNIAVLNAIEGYSPLLASTFANEFSKLGGHIVAKETYQSNSFDVSTPVRNLLGFQNEIEGIYIPLADKVDAPIILSKLSEFGFDKNIYGNQDWILARGFESAPSLSEKITFSSDYFIDYNSGEFLDFSREFFSFTKKDVNRNILYGYDAAKYALSILRNIAGGNKVIKQKMESGFVSTGFHNNISFGGNHINLFLNIVRYRNQMFELVDKFKSSN